MAIVQNPLIGRSSQSFGNAVFKKWKDKNVIATKPLSGKKEPTEKQLLQQQKFKNAIDFYRKFKTVVDAGYKARATTSTQGNLFTGHIMKDCLTETMLDGLMWAPEAIMFSKGWARPNPQRITHATENGKSYINLNWEDVQQNLPPYLSLSHKKIAIQLGFDDELKEALDEVTEEVELKSVGNLRIRNRLKDDGFLGHIFTYLVIYDPVGKWAMDTDMILHEFYS